MRQAVSALNTNTLAGQIAPANTHVESAIFRSSNSKVKSAKIANLYTDGYSPIPYKPLLNSPLHLMMLGQTDLPTGQNKG